MIINNLFSSFDPSSSFIKLNWIILFTRGLFLILDFKWKSKFLKGVFVLIRGIYKEILPITRGFAAKGGIEYYLGIILMVLCLNFLGLFPFIFSSTAHICLNFSLRIILWSALILFGYLINFKNIIIHLVPTGTPKALLPLIVLIEIVRSLIRPITLSVRLTANLIAGHLLIILLGELIIRSIRISILGSIAMLALGGLELAVSFIQAYVFITLLSLYSTEIH